MRHLSKQRATKRSERRGAGTGAANSSTHARTQKRPQHDRLERDRFWKNDFTCQTAREAWDGYGSAISRRGAPEFCGERFALLEKRARGTPDAPCVRSLMRKV